MTPPSALYITLFIVVGAAAFLMTLSIYGLLLRITRKKYIWFFIASFLLPFLGLVIPRAAVYLSHHMDTESLLTLITYSKRVLSLTIDLTFIIGCYYFFKDIRNIKRENWLTLEHQGE